MKVIAFYLPQFHAIPENDEWWGKGFTEWVNVKKAKPFFNNHNQPRVPLNDNYYNLLDSNVQQWQIEIAKKHNIYGFCYYHYWFDGHLLLEKPMENMLNNKNLDFPFCICWANEDWTKAWVSQEDTVLISQNYGDKKEWKEHFEYLLKFFKDERYIIENNMPVLVIYRPQIVRNLNEMLDYWNELSITEGFNGIKFAYQSPSMDYIKNKDDSRFTYNIEAQPSYARMELGLSNKKLLKKIYLNLKNILEKKGINVLKKQNKGLSIRSYDEAWETILNMKPKTAKSIPGAFVDFDNTPRRGDKGTLYSGVSVEKFRFYFDKLVEKAINEYKTDKIFIFAWNEWAEGGYLEPDTLNEFGYLEAIRDVLDKWEEE